MDRNKIGNLVFYILGLLLGVIALVFTYSGLPANYDTEPILGFGIILIALAGIMSIKMK